MQVEHCDVLAAERHDADEAVRGEKPSEETEAGTSRAASANRGNAAGQAERVSDSDPLDASTVCARRCTTRIGDELGGSRRVRELGVELPARVLRSALGERRELDAGNARHEPQHDLGLFRTLGR